MTNEEMIALRAMLREEINAAIYASEQRTGERFDKLETRMDKFETATDERFNNLETRMGKFETMMELMTRDLVLMKVGLREVQSDLVDVKGELKQVVSVLGTATSAINELQANQRALDIKITYAVQALNARMDRHERLPIDKAHPLPESAA